MKKIIIKISLIAIAVIMLGSCVKQHLCSEYKGEDGLMHINKDDCSQTTYLAGIIPMG